MARRRNPGRDDDALNEQEAVAMGLAIFSAKWDGDSDFERGMRLLQEHLFGKKGQVGDGQEGDDRQPVGGT